MAEMKYCIETAESELPDDAAEAIRYVLHEYPFEYVTTFEDSEMIETREEAEKELARNSSTIELTDEGNYKLKQVFMNYGEAVLNEEISEDLGEDVYELDGYTIEKVASFDAKSLEILKSLGITDKDLEGAIGA